MGVLIEFAKNATSIKNQLASEKNIVLLNRAREQVVEKPVGYYVYSHRFPNGGVYFGKGSGSRYYQLFKSGRSWLYERTLEEASDIEVDIIADGLSESDAYWFEHQLITFARSRYGSNLLNITDGLEDSPEDSMPWRTLAHSRRKVPPGSYSLTCVSMEDQKNGFFYFGIALKTAAVIARQSIDAMRNCILSGDAVLSGGFRLLRRGEAEEYVDFLKTVIYLAKDDGSDTCVCEVGFYFSWTKGLHGRSLSLFGSGAVNKDNIVEYINSNDHDSTIFEGFRACSADEVASLCNGVLPPVFMTKNLNVEEAYKEKDFFDAILPKDNLVR